MFLNSKQWSGRVQWFELQASLCQPEMWVKHHELCKRNRASINKNEKMNIISVNTLVIRFVAFQIRRAHNITLAHTQADNTNMLTKCICRCTIHAQGTLTLLASQFPWCRKAPVATHRDSHTHEPLFCHTGGREASAWSRENAQYIILVNAMALSKWISDYA